MSKKQIRLFFLIGGIFLAPLVLFSTKMNPWTQGDYGSSLFQEITYPFAWVWHASITTVGDHWNRYVMLQGAANENAHLKIELEDLRVKLLSQNELSVEVNRLRKLAGFTERLDDKYTIAEVLLGQRNTAFKTIRISKGAMDGLATGMPVITSDGIVGRLIRVGAKMSDVQLIVDYDSNIDILIQRNRIRGVLSGFAAEDCRLHLQRGTEVKIGDAVITSGIVGSFPKGLPVGKVVKISFETDNVSQVITVEPWVDHRRLEEVIVLLRKDPDIELIIKTAGTEWIDKSTNAAAVATGSTL
ncbi:MAG: rod shape-determining protein MreC [Proteobacteria bacterium]|nr:rod shape-determining protein MreC [Pseudomonadota bacterium]